MERRAKALAKKLGHGWTPEVWENLGWHSRVVSGDMALHIHKGSLGKVQYSLFVDGIAYTGQSPKRLLQQARGRLRATAATANNTLQQVLTTLTRYRGV